MKSSKIWRIIWIIGIYAILSCLLYLVILYKVKWEHKDLNTYLYFYNCNDNLCTTTYDALNDYYNRIMCENDICPYIDTVVGSNVILKRDNTSYIYNYITGKIISSDYNYYRYISDDKYVVGNDFNQYGIINGDNNLLVPIKYNMIDEFKFGYISYIDNNLYGIIRIADEYKIDAKYEDIVLVNEKIFAGRMNNIYQLYSYDNPDDENANKYDYVYAYKDVILVVNNNKIDILNSNLKSTLLMKIDSFYSYTTEKERGSLKIRTDNNNIYFRVFINENEYTEYVYNVSNKKMI